MSPRSGTGRVGIYTAYRKLRYLARRGTLFGAYPDKHKGSPMVPHGTFRYIFLNSTFLFLVSYALINALNQFVTGFTALAFDIPVIVYHAEVDYLIRSIDWTHDSVTGVFSSGPIAMLVLTFFLVILFKAVESETGLGRLLVLWMIFQALTRFFGEILVGALLNQGFGFVILYLFFMDTGKVIITILAFVAQFTAGLVLTRFSVYTANIWFNDLRGAYRLRFLVSQFLLPFLTGMVIVTLLKLPGIHLFDLLVNASMILMIAAVMARGVGIEDLYFDLDKRPVRLSMTALWSALAILAIYRLVLGLGVRL